MRRRVALLLTLALGLTWILQVPAGAQTAPPPSASSAEEEQAAAQVLDQLDQAVGPLTPDQIPALDSLGPPPWLSLGRDRSPKVIEAWTKVMEQLPGDKAASRRKPRQLTYKESEGAGQTGTNDTAATGERIRRFGTGNGDARSVTITGNLSGAEVREPFPFDCTSTEDDGAIPTANPTPVDQQTVSICGGVIGDGPYGQSSGDIDIYSFGEVEVGSTVVIDVAQIAGSLQPVDAFTGLYDGAGNLVASIHDDGDPNASDYLIYDVTATGTYYAAVAGCCQLDSDPFDSSSGPGAGPTGTYEMYMVAIPPPCVSVEDDGSIAQANKTRVGVAGSDFCSGTIGDGPHGTTSGDADFYRLDAVPAGKVIVASAFVFGDEVDPADTVLGLYDAAGNLLTSAAQVPGDTGVFLSLEAPGAGDYYVQVAGCCDLTSDPTDPASGPGVGSTGTYNLDLFLTEPPCLSVEDDGSIGLANDASRGQGDDTLFVNFCSGELGDGPHAATTGDTDFFTTREMQAGKVLVVDFSDYDGTEAASAFIIGVYDDAGNLIASGTDSASPIDSNYFHVTVPATGVYHVAVTGGLPTDPLDPSSGTNATITGSYGVYLVDITQDLLDQIMGTSAAGWDTPSARSATPVPSPTDHRARQRQLALDTLAEARRAADAKATSGVATDPPVVDIDYYLVDLKKGDAISGGFDDARYSGIVDPDGVVRMSSPFNPSVIYPAGSPLAHSRRQGFDHVVTRSGTYAVFVDQGIGAYEGELHVVRSGLADQRSRAQQTIYLDFNGASVAPGIYDPFAPDPGAEVALSPLSSFLADWGLGPADENAVIDAAVDAVIENLDQDLRVGDGRNGNRDGNRKGGQFDIEVLNSRDNPDVWGRPDVSRVVIGGTIDELGIPTIGIAQSIDPGNTDTTETAVVLLDVLSGPAGDSSSLNSYELAPGRARTELVGAAIGNIAAHEAGHFLGNWHTDTFNGVVSIMDAGGEFESIFQVGADGVFGTADDVDPDFSEDVFNTFEGFSGLEDTAGRAVFGLSTGQLTVPGPPGRDH